MFSLSWMAWTLPTAAFFVFIVCCLAGMAVWEHYVPGGTPRRGVLGLETTRGDRLFISLIGAAYVFLGWLWVMGTPLWAPLALSILLAFAVFRWV
ncbi:DUF2160 domain-containing protein [Limibacillus sp. MBR-115]|jgi:predicted small integral membrane protein|uniref:DUF2160 domain-containing protein n=1 Tax=Limibacillus sp. MBR-115 TaxID=3156465 RepID=UPI003398B09A